MATDLNDQTDAAQGDRSASADARAGTADVISGEQALQRISELERELAEYKDSYLRAMADYKNFKRRTDQERADLLKSAGAAVLLKVLPIIDDLERAIGNTTPEISGTAWFSGFKLIPQKLNALLESEGVTPIAALGAPFDPTRHEAVIYEDAPGQAELVIAELQRGFMIRDRVLRPSLVKVGKA